MTDTPVTEAAVLAALAELGDTPDMVAETLRAQGVQGDREEPTSCPVANYLARRFRHSDWDVECVNVEDIILGDTDGEVKVRTPRPVEQFIEAFDSGGYPALDFNPEGFTPEGVE